MYDIAIIGAGPAGSTLARLISKQYKVLLLDKRPLDAGVPYKKVGHGEGVATCLVKCCGGLVAPDAQKIMGEMGMGLPQSVLTGPQLFSVRTIDLEQAMERYYQRFYINVDREKLDRWLVSQIPAGIELRTGCQYKSFQRKEGCLEIRFTHHGNEFVEKAKLLVGADGAQSMVRELAFPGIPTPQKYVAMQEWFEDKQALPYFSAIFDREITDFYSWTIPKAGCIIVGAALAPGKDADHKFQLLKKKLGGYGYELGKAVKREGAFVFRPVKNDQIYTGSDGVALLGEAAGWISPSSAEGLSYAFKSALVLAESLGSGLDGALERYAHHTKSLRWNIRVKQFKSPFMYHSLLRKTVMATGVQCMDIKMRGDR
jgi:geranylgeranyl diphosphate/geranylgeranyl-bacteriochlorophyllide a reductase